MPLRYLLFIWLLLSGLVAACQPGAALVAEPVPLGPPPTPGQPGRWQGPPAPAASPAQRVTAPLIPFRQQNLYGLLTPQGQVVVVPTFTGPVQRVAGSRHLWWAELPAGAPLPLVLLNDSGRVLGHYRTVAGAAGRWHWTQAEGPRHTLTLYDSLGHLMRATPYGKLGYPAEGRLVAALPDSLLTDGSGGVLPGLRGVLDSLGRELVPCRYTALEDYRRGYAFATIETPWPAMKLLHKGVLDRQGREHWLPAQWHTASLKYEGGFFAGRSNELRAATALSIDGRVLVPYSAGLQAITRTDFEQGDLIQVEGADPSAPAGRSRRGLGYYTFDSGELRPLLPLRYERLEPVTHGWTILHAYDPAWPGRTPGYGDPAVRGVAWRGRVVVPAEGGGVDISRDGRFATVYYKGSYVVSELGSPARPLPGAEQVRYLSHGVFAVRQAGKWGLMRASGQVLRPCVDEIYLDRLEKDRYFYQNGSWADTLGRPVLPAGQFEAAGFLTSTLAWVSQAGRYSIYSVRTHKLLLPLTLSSQPSADDSLYWGSDGQRTLVGWGMATPLVVADPRFRPLVVAWPYLLLGYGSRPAGLLPDGAPAKTLITSTGQLVSTSVTGLAGGVRGGTVWACNVQGAYALLDAQGHFLTPFGYNPPSAYEQGYWLTHTQAGEAVAVDCLGRVYAW